MPTARVQVVQNLDDLAARRRAAADATPAPARIRLNVVTSGLGEVRLNGRRAVGFGAVILEEPSFSYGLISQLASVPAKRMPMATATVLRWRRSAAGFYVGAELGFSIYLPLMAAEDYAGQDFTHFAMKWSLTFEGMTLRSTAGMGASGDSPLA